MRLLRTYLVRPFNKILSNKSILILILILVLVDRFREFLGIDFEILQTDNLGRLLTGIGLFETFPSDILKLLEVQSTYLAFVLIISLFFLQSLLTVIIVLDLKLIYQNHESGIFSTINSIIVRDVLWYFVFAIVVYIFFTVIWLIFYFIGYLLWKYQEINSSIPVLLIGLLLFPSFYAMLSIGAKMSVININWNEKFSKMLFLLRIKNIVRIYTFYPLRLIIEFGCVSLAFAVSFTLFRDHRLSLIFGIFALLIPLATFRASTFEFFLDLYKSDPIIQQLFREHFAKKTIF